MESLLKRALLAGEGTRIAELAQALFAHVSDEIADVEGGIAEAVEIEIDQANSNG